MYCNNKQKVVSFTLRETFHTSILVALSSAWRTFSMLYRIFVRVLEPLATLGGFKRRQTFAVNPTNVSSASPSYPTDARYRADCDTVRQRPTYCVTEWMTRLPSASTILCSLRPKCALIYGAHVFTVKYVKATICL